MMGRSGGGDWSGFWLWQRLADDGRRLSRWMFLCIFFCIPKGVCKGIWYSLTRVPNAVAVWSFHSKGLYRMNAEGGIDERVILEWSQCKISTRHSQQIIIP